MLSLKMLQAISILMNPSIVNGNGTAYTLSRSRIWPFYQRAGEISHPGAFAATCKKKRGMLPESFKKYRTPVIEPALVTKETAVVFDPQ